MNRNGYYSVLLAISLIVFAGTALCTEVYGYSPKERTLTEKLVDTAGDVLLEAAEFGLDWAGEKLLGSKGWEGLKKILSPVVARLQERTRR